MLRAEWSRRNGGHGGEWLNRANGRCRHQESSSPSLHGLNNATRQTKSDGISCVSLHPVAGFSARDMTGTGTVGGRGLRVGK